MKYSIWLLFLVSLGSVQAQDRFTTQEDYQRKANRQQTVAWVLAGSGATMIAAGTILAINTDWDELDYSDNSHGKRETFKAAGAIGLIGTGVIAAVGSIPLFIISAKNKSKAGSLSVSNMSYQSFRQSGLHTASAPALTLRIRL